MEEATEEHNDTCPQYNFNVAKTSATWFVLTKQSADSIVEADTVVKPTALFLLLKRHCCGLWELEFTLGIAYTGVVIRGRGAGAD